MLKQGCLVHCLGLKINKAYTVHTQQVQRITGVPHHRVKLACGPHEESWALPEWRLGAEVAAVLPSLLVPKLVQPSLRNTATSSITSECTQKALADKRDAAGASARSELDTTLATHHGLAILIDLFHATAIQGMNQKTRRWCDFGAQ